MGYRIVRALLKFFFLFTFRIKVNGKENMLKTGGAIVCINHRSNWDVPVAGAYGVRQFGFMAKSELFKNKLLGGFLKMFGAFPVQRGKGDLGAIKAALQRLKNDEIVAMFPEGKRVKNNEIVSAKPGAVMLAHKAKVPIIPIKLEGGYKWLSKVTMTIGEPISYKMYYDEKLSVEKLQELTDELMKTIRSLNV